MIVQYPDLRIAQKTAAHIHCYFRSTSSPKSSQDTATMCNVTSNEQTTTNDEKILVDVTSVEFKRWRASGNIAHILVLINAIGFMVSVLLFNETPYFDGTWLEEGFCVSNKETPHLNSHSLSFYVDAVTSVLLFLAYRKYNGVLSEQCMNHIYLNIAGVLMHGLAHLNIAYAGNAVEQNAAQQMSIQERYEEDPTKFIIQTLTLLGFWVGLLRASMPEVSMKYVLPMSLFVGSLPTQFLVKAEFGFTYVQTVLLLAASFNQLNLPIEKKGYVYSTFAIVVSLPVGLVGWLESQTCGDFMIQYGGHVFYDGGICASLLVFLLLCINHHEAHNTPKVKTL